MESNSDLLTQDPAAPPFWRTQEYANANGLYMLLKCANAAVQYSEVVAKMDDLPGPVSLQNLIEVGRTFCSSVDAVYIKTADLSSLAAPVLAHMDTWGGDAKQPGAFVLVYGVDASASNALVISSLTGTPSAIPIEHFARVCSGVGLQVNSGRGTGPSVVLLVAAISVMFAFAVRGVVAVKRVSRRGRARRA